MEKMCPHSVRLVGQQETEKRRWRQV